MLTQLRNKVTWLQALAVILTFTASFFVGKFAADWGTPDIPTAQNEQNTGGDPELPVDRLNVLLLGVDARPGEQDARSDSLIVVSIDRSTKKIAMVSIPRDSLVEIPGRGKGKINTANAFGGAELARTTVEDLLGIEIPYYVKTNFEGFQEIVDTLGGVELEVDKRMYYPSEGINLKPGKQMLNGSNALAYVRFRHDALGDIARTQRQQKFLSALAKETLQASTIIKLPRLIPQLMGAVETNLGVRNAAFLAKAVSGLDPENIVTATLPGTFYNYKGASYWKVDEDKTKVVLNDLFHGTTVATISGPDINVPKDKPVYNKIRSQGARVEVKTVENKETVNDPTPAPNQGGSGGGQQNTQNSGDQNSQGQDSTGLPPDASSDSTGQVPGSNTQTPGQNDQNPTNSQIPGQSTGGTTQPPVSGSVIPPVNSGNTGSTTPGTSQGSVSGSSGSASSVAVPKVDSKQG